MRRFRHAEDCRATLVARGSFAILAAGALVLLSTSSASANGFEIPENGTEVMGRAGAWTAKADNPMAASLNPAGLAGQPTAFLVNTNLTWQKLCFQRSGTYSSDATNGGTRFQGSTYGGQAYPEVCKNNGVGDVNIVPQLAFNYAVNEKLGIAFALVTPSSAGKAKWPDQVTLPNGDLAPAPQRYMLLEQNGVVVSPTLSAGYEVAKGVRFGAGFMWTMAFLKFSNISHATNSVPSDAAEGPNADLRADLSVKKLFVPGFVLGALITPHEAFDIGAMFKWSADIHATSGDVTITGPYYGDGKKPANSSVSTPANLGEFRLPAPWEARIGFRLHPARKDGKVVTSGKRRDLLSSDAFDIELDVTYAHNKTVDQITLLFPPGQPVALGQLTSSAGFVPADASSPHNWKDTVGVRLGGEVPVLPDQLAVRAGAFYQTVGQDAKFLAIDFLPSAMVGLYLGGTYRISPKVDLSVGYGHIFLSGLDNNGVGGGYGLVAQETWDPGVCPQSPAGQKGRTCNPVNNGKVTGGYNMGSIGVTVRL